ncbi:MAG TPA: hypothetical protein VGL22_18620 [Terracidiphilus sp.]|jgi:hypothetical protein
MRRLLTGATLAFALIRPGSAQSIEDLNIQIYGYATQGFLYTNYNNTFYAMTTNGSPAWTEAVVNMTAQPKSGLSIGVQARYQLLGASGNSITLDWAAADFKVNDSFGVRVGKVKTPWGLMNETQDIDPSYIWTLLPQSVYDITTRNADLSHYGGLAYGAIEPGTKAGKFDYYIWGGEQVVPADDGQFDDLNNAGTGPTSPLNFTTIGGALHWRTPLPGLMLGASDGKENAGSVELHGGSQHFAPWNNVSWFGRFDHKKWMAGAEWNRQASASTLSLDGQPSSPENSDARGWFVMASYKWNDKLSLGAYRSDYFEKQAELGPDRYTKDWTASMRYDFNQFIYLKADQHFVKGTALSLDSFRNPSPHPDYLLTAMKIGVSF